MPTQYNHKQPLLSASLNKTFHLNFEKTVYICICDNQSVEDEIHIFINCPLCKDLRFNLYQHAQLCFSNIMLLCVTMSESILVFITAKTCFYILTTF